jgi:hypothetical protein
MKRNNKVFWGAVLVVCGIIWIVCICLHINVLFNGWWTLFIIVPSLCGLLAPGARAGGKTWPAIGLGVGILFLLAEQNVIDYDMFWKIGLAVLVIALGLGMIFGRGTTDGDDRHIAGGDSSQDGTAPITLNRDGKSIRVVNASFGEQNLNFGGEVFEGADVNASFASVHLDLHGATINEDMEIHVDLKFSGLVIYAPSDLLVKVTAGSTFGGVDDKRRVVVTDHTHTLYISGSCVFSGIEIK